MSDSKQGEGGRNLQHEIERVQPLREEREVASAQRGLLREQHGHKVLRQTFWMGVIRVLDHSFHFSTSLPLAQKIENARPLDSRQHANGGEPSAFPVQRLLATALMARFSCCRPKGSQAVGGRRTATRTAHRTAQCQGPAPPRSRICDARAQSGRRSATSGVCRTGPSALSATACSRPGASLGTPSRQPQCTAGRRTSLGARGCAVLFPSHIRTHTPRSASRRCRDRSSQRPPLPSQQSQLPQFFAQHWHGTHGTQSGCAGRATLQA